MIGLAKYRLPQRTPRQEIICDFHFESYDGRDASYLAAVREQSMVLVRFMGPSLHVIPDFRHANHFERFLLGLVAAVDQFLQALFGGQEFRPNELGG